MLADPPWNERGGGKVKRGADRHYPVMSTPEIVRTMIQAPAWRPADNAHLWLWVTNNYLRDGLFVMEALGFRYVTNVAWVKVDDRGQVQMGLGQYVRGSHELLLFGVRGRLRALSNAVKSAEILAPRTQHSRKPEQAYTLIEAVTPGPRVELFARRRRDGWDTWGNDPEVASA